MNSYPSFIPEIEGSTLFTSPYPIEFHLVVKERMENS